MRDNQASTVWQAREPSAWRQAQSEAALSRVSTTIMRDSGMPASANAGAYGSMGGEIQLTQRLRGVWRSMGCSRPSSPMPGRAAMSSMMVPRGQPRSGSSASSAAKPVDQPEALLAAMRLPVQTRPGGMASISVDTMFAAGMMLLA